MTPAKCRVLAERRNSGNLFINNARQGYVCRKADTLKSAGYFFSGAT